MGTDKVFAIICEYNPFHNGHKRQIEIAKSETATHIVAIMSSCFVQRGDVAIMSKKARTLSALSCGADLVVELPVVWSLSSAGYFAKAAMYIAKGLSFVDGICFGSESADITSLLEISELEKDKNVQEKIKYFLNQGNSYPKSRTLALAEFISQDKLNILSKANDILALEYIKACKELSALFEFLPIKRNTEHDSDICYNNISSSSFIRKLILQNDDSYTKYIPSKVSDIIKEEIDSKQAPANIINLERAILMKLRELSKDDFFCLPDVSEGLHNRIYNCVQTSSSFKELCDKIKTKRYTHSRIRRILLCAVLGINKELQSSMPQYARILGFNDRGRELLKTCRNNTQLPLVSKACEIKKLNKTANEIFKIEDKAQNIFALATPEISPCGRAFTEAMTKN